MFSNKDNNLFDQIWRRKIYENDQMLEYRKGENLRVDYCLSQLDHGETLLDIGCGTGIFANQAKVKYENVYGIDIAEKPVEMAISIGVNASVCNLNTEKLDFKDGMFDAVTMLSTIQYFYDLNQVCSEIKRVLKPNGKLFITFPNMRTYWRIYKLLITGRFPKVSKDAFGYDGGTLHYFCYRDVKALMEDHDFKILQSSGIICSPKFFDSFLFPGLLNKVKREFFCAEIFIQAKKEEFILR